jgi:hypothetical protein
MSKSLLIASALLLQLSSLSLAAQAAPQDKAVGKAATYYRHLELAREGSKNLVKTQVAEGAKNSAVEAQVATEHKIQPATTVTNPPAQNKAASTQASTAQ